ncbi:MAG: helix-turn-helix domain-containing protein [Proteobacteria bacterium]|nr:helix-turn-helix domain-containing protein [Pseudomonadota bacterium]MBU1716563.1 helix-turn-helix domain-containing protein [Pseudomonadota bacterium]
MNREDYRHYFDILELPLESSLADVRKAYLFLREVYTIPSIVTMPVDEEISSEQKEEIVRQIEEAYHGLLLLFNEEHNTTVEDISNIVSGVSVFDGAVLKQIREKLRINLDDMAMATRIQQKHLVNLESDNYEALPVNVYTRGFVVSYAKYLSLDPEMVAESYMSKLKQRKKTGR